MPLIGRPPIYQVTPTLYTAGAYTASRVLFDATQVGGVAILPAGSVATVSNLEILDKAKQANAFDLYFLGSNVSIGAANAAEALSAANGVYLLHKFSVAVADYKTLANVSLASYGASTLGAFRLAALDGLGYLYIAAVLGATTPTYSAGALVITLGLIGD